MKSTLQKVVSFACLFQLAVLLLILNQPAIALATANKSVHKNAVTAQCDPDDLSCTDDPPTDNDPTITITASSYAVTAPGTSTIFVTAEDDKGIDHITLAWGGTEDDTENYYSQEYSGGGKTMLSINKAFRFTTDSKSSYTFIATVVDTAGRRSEAEIDVTVTIPHSSEQGSFTLSASTAEGFAGGNASTEVTVTSRKGFTGTVTVTVEGSVANFVSLESCTVFVESDKSVACPTNATFQIPSSISSSPGTYDFLNAVQGRSSSKSAKTKLRLKLKGVVAVAAGASHSLALDSEGRVWAWGQNDHGQLGNGSTIDSSTAVQVPNLNNVTAIAAGADHSLAIVDNDGDGEIWAWGANNYGQLGDGTTTSRLTPIDIQSLGHVTAIAAGTRHSLALVDADNDGDGSIFAWGDNEVGQLGNGTIIGSSIPVQVQTLSQVTAIAAADWHSLAIKDDGNVWAWGDGYCGALGNGSPDYSSIPVQSQDISQVANIAAGYQYSLALKNNGDVLAWGYNHVQGCIFTPEQLQSLSQTITIAAGDYHSLAVEGDGSVWAWGYNGDGQLGDGTQTDSSTPTQVQGLSQATAIAAGYRYSLVLKSNGSVWAWGDNHYGQLGDGTQTDSSTPIQILFE